MKYDFVVFGADGMQGKIVTRDLLETGYSIFAADLYKSRVEPIIKKYPETAFFTFVDLRDIDMTINIIEKSGADVVINCAEGDWNLNVYNACLHTKTHCIDLGSRIDMTEEQLKMDSLFKKIKRTAITGCGSVPGIGNVMLKYAAKKFDKLDRVDVGFAWDSNIKKFVVPFSIQSIFEELTLPAPTIENKKWVYHTPMKTMKIRRHKSIGYQKVFIADHPETYTFHHYFKDKGLKNIHFFAGFPHHSTKVLFALLEIGFNSSKPIKIQGTEIAPVDFLTQTLKRLRMPKNYKERENLWVEITGSKKKEEKTILMECIVPPVKGWEEAGCNIDTGFPVSIMAQMIKNNEIKLRGSFAPEAIIPEKAFFKELRKRKMLIYENGKTIN